MNKPIIRSPSTPRVCAALLTIIVASASGIGSAATASGPSRSANVILAQNTVQEKTPAAPIPAPAAAPSAALTWTFAAPQPADGTGWTVERGTLTTGKGKTSLRPDANRRVVLVSPPGLPEAARYAEEFVVGVEVPGCCGMGSLLCGAGGCTAHALKPNTRLNKVMRATVLMVFSS